MKGLPTLRGARLSRKARLQAVLRDRGISQAEIGRRTGTSEATVSRVVAGTQRHERVEQAIADALEVERDELFPAPASAAA